jgi:hypothetical protein
MFRLGRSDGVVVVVVVLLSVGVRGQIRLHGPFGGLGQPRGLRVIPSLHGVRHEAIRQVRSVGVNQKGDHAAVRGS